MPAALMSRQPCARAHHHHDRSGPSLAANSVLGAEACHVTSSGRGSTRTWTSGFAAFQASATACRAVAVVPTPTAVAVSSMGSWAVTAAPEDMTRAVRATTDVPRFASPMRVTSSADLRDEGGPESPVAPPSEHGRRRQPAPSRRRWYAYHIDALRGVSNLGRGSGARGGSHERAHQLRHRVDVPALGTQRIHERAGHDDAVRERRPAVGRAPAARRRSRPRPGPG